MSSFDEIRDLVNASPRAEVLDEAKDLITGDRNSQYGPPDIDFRRSAEAMNAMGFRKLDNAGEVIGLEPRDVAFIQILVKMSRAMWSPTKRDHYVDLCGYSACAWECASISAEGGN